MLDLNMKVRVKNESTSEFVRVKNFHLQKF